LTVAAPIVWSSGNALSLTATRNLAIDSTISGGTLNLFASGLISEASGASVTANSLMFGAQSTTASINFQGSLAATSLSFLTGSAAKFNAVSFRGATTGDVINIGTIDFGSAPSFFTGNILVDNRSSTTGLTVQGSTGLAATNVTLLTGGDLTLAPGANLTPSGTVTLAAEGTGHFVNNAGAGVFSNGGPQVPSRFLIYAPDASGDTNLGGLVATGQTGVSFPADPLGSGNIFYVSSGPPPITVTTTTTTVITTTDSTNIGRSANGCTTANPCVTVTNATGLTLGPVDDPQLAAFVTNAGTEWTGQEALSLIQKNWTATGGGYDQTTVDRYALALCEQTASAASCAADPGAALIAVMIDLENGSLSEDAILAWTKLRGAVGWAAHRQPGSRRRRPARRSIRRSIRSWPACGRTPSSRRTSAAPRPW
jgi:hypothetical protein